MATFYLFCKKSGSVGHPSDPLNFSVGSILSETIVWIYNLTVMIVSHESFLCKQKSVNNHSIPSMHAERKITKYSFAPYPSFSPYRRMDKITDRGTNTLAARGLEVPFFHLCCCVSVFWFWREIGFGVTYVLRVQYSCGIVLVFWFWQKQFLVLHTYLVYNTVVRLCQFFGCGGKEFLCDLRKTLIGFLYFTETTQ